MEITDIRVRKINTEARMKAIVSVTFDEVFVVHDIKIVQGEKGVFVAMPSKRMPDGTYKDIAHPIATEMRTILQQRVMEAYEVALAEESEQKTEETDLN